VSEASWCWLTSHRVEEVEDASEAAQIMVIDKSFADATTDVPHPKRKRLVEVSASEIRDGTYGLGISNFTRHGRLEQPIHQAQSSGTSVGGR
jgi:hypothetical protein